MKIKNKEMRRTNVKKTLVLVIILGLFLANFVTIAGASPDLAEVGKDYIATNFGLGTPKCYVASGLSWSYLGTDGNTYPESGGTAQIVSRLVMTALVTSLTISGTTYTYADLKAGNENTDVTLEDAKWIAENDGDPATETQYCIGVTPTPASTPTLTGAGKDWLVTYAGVDNCFQTSGISYKDADGVSHTGSTGDVANSLFVAHLVGKDDVVITADGKTYSDFKTASGGNDLTIVDVGWVYNNEGGAGKDKYCIGGTSTPMALTENCKQYIAQYLGIVKNSDFCFSDTTAVTVKYWDANDVSHIGSTIDAFATIAMLGGYSYEDKVAETGRIDAVKLTSENGGVSLTNDDIVWIANHSDGVDKYCYSPDATPTPIPSTPSPTPTPTHTPTPSPISSPSPTPTLVDSDGDGVPDRYDYAPYDSNVQTKGD
ncbi:MAG: hypothetical protein KAT65_20000, partial [Methanophagales archaeon]|nr:hypothetical protein [Methanophagales archaeon]